MQTPTCEGISVWTIADARVILHAVACGVLPMIVRRLDVNERLYILPGSVFVWEERDAFADATGVGITRWTDGRRWGPSRVRDEFLYYHEKLPEIKHDPALRDAMLSTRLVKQTYSAFVDTPTGRRKWHLVAYYTTQTRDGLHTVDVFPALRALRNGVPEGAYMTARVAKGRARSEQREEQHELVDGSSQLTMHTPDSPLPRRESRTPPTPDAFALPLIENDVPALSTYEGVVSVTSTEVDVYSMTASLPDPFQSESHSHALRGGPPSHNLAPLIYMRKSPYPPRHPIDSVALRSLDCRVRIL